MLANRFMTLPEPFESVVREMDQAFGDVFARNGSAPAIGRQAPVALWDDDEKVFVQVEVPGIRREDLDVTVHDGKLIISGQRKPAEQTGKCWYNEQFYGAFERVIALSDMIQTDSIDAELSDGVLSVTLHKKPEAKPHRVTIGVRNSDNHARIEAEHESAATSAET